MRLMDTVTVQYVFRCWTNVLVMIFSCYENASRPLVMATSHFAFETERSVEDGEGKDGKGAQ